MNGARQTDPTGAIRRVAAVAAGTHSEHLAVNRRSPADGVFPAFQHERRRPFADHGSVPIADPTDLAFALVRLGESFLYADVLAARQPDADAANRIQQALIAPHTSVPTLERTQHGF